MNVSRLEVSNNIYPQLSKTEIGLRRYEKLKELSDSDFLMTYHTSRELGRDCGILDSDKATNWVYNLKRKGYLTEYLDNLGQRCFKLTNKEYIGVRGKDLEQRQVCAFNQVRTFNQVPEDNKIVITKGDIKIELYNCDINLIKDILYEK